MTKPTAVLFCPGRGSYTKDELGFLGRTVRQGPIADALAACDEWRRSQGRPTLTEIDGAEKFRPGLHLDGENAAELIFFGTMAHQELLRERYEILAVAGNSLGWYTALPASGALDPTSGWRLVATMAALQKQVKGGQVLMTNVGEDWKPNLELVVATQAVVQALRDRGHDTYCDFSIHLGGHEVLAGTEAAVTELLTHLPKVKIG
ncbi:MAG: ACP S-malonyltransferase, partial [Planctomycetes bacterium]|nr:ACP S-malonyltransferase [Planctomycetota bacterium]